VNPSVGTTILPAPLGHINVHIRDGSVLLLHSNPAYTTEETRQGPYSLLVSLDSQSFAYGSAYIDDGISSPPASNRTLSFMATHNQLVVNNMGTFTIEQKLQEITVLGVKELTESLTLNNAQVVNFTYDVARQKLVVQALDADLNQPLLFTWQ